MKSVLVIFVLFDTELWSSARPGNSASARTTTVASPIALRVSHPIPCRVNVGSMGSEMVLFCDGQLQVWLVGFGFATKVYLPDRLVRVISAGAAMMDSCLS
jgi:hypothetical protein